MKRLAGFIASFLLTFSGVAAAGCQEFYGEEFRTDRATLWGNGMICDFPGQHIVSVDFYQAQDYDGNYTPIDASYTMNVTSTSVYVGFNISYPEDSWFSMEYTTTNGFVWQLSPDNWDCSDPFCGLLDIPGDVDNISQP